MKRSAAPAPRSSVPRSCSGGSCSGSCRCAQRAEPGTRLHVLRHLCVPLQAYARKLKAQGQEYKPQKHKRKVAREQGMMSGQPNPKKQRAEKKGKKKSRHDTPSWRPVEGRVQVRAACFLRVTVPQHTSGSSTRLYCRWLFSPSFGTCAGQRRTLCSRLQPR